METFSLFSLPPSLSLLTSAMFDYPEDGIARVFLRPDEPLRREREIINEAFSFPSPPLPLLSPFS